jgi:hypothetical protein
MPATTSKVAMGVGWVGFAAHLAMLVWYLATTLVAPPWAVVVLVIIWCGMTVFAWRQVRSDRPLWTLGVPVIDAAIWFAVVTLGEVFLDGTA